MASTTTAIFRRYSAIEEAMIRATMPRVSARDLEPVPAYGRATQRTAKNLTFHMAINSEGN